MFKQSLIATAITTLLLTSPASFGQSHQSNRAIKGQYIVVLETHDEFTGRIGQGYSAIDDGNGTTDCSGHGTHVSGTVARAPISLEWHTRMSKKRSGKEAKCRNSRSISSLDDAA